MVKPLIIHHNSKSWFPSAEILEGLRQNPRPVLWIYNGLHGVLPSELIQNELRIRGDRKRIAESLGELEPWNPPLGFRWAETLTVSGESNMIEKIVVDGSWNGYVESIHRHISEMLGCPVNCVVDEFERGTVNFYISIGVAWFKCSVNEREFKKNSPEGRLKLIECRIEFVLDNIKEHLSSVSLAIKNLDEYTKKVTRAGKH